LNRFSIDELLRPFQATANLCQCLWQDPFVLHASRQATSEILAEAAAKFSAMLEGLIDG
jgi:glutathione-regulated potassium-efflux system ancillary protein KefG